VKSVVVIGQERGFEVKSRGTYLCPGGSICDDQYVRGEFSLEQGIQPIIRHGVFAEFDVRVVLKKLTTGRRVVKFRSRHELNYQSFAFAPDAPVFGGRMIFFQPDTNLAAQVKAIQFAGRRQKAVVKQVGRSFSWLGKCPDRVGKYIMAVVGFAL